MERLHGIYTSVMEDCIKELLRLGATLSELEIVRDVDGSERVLHRPSGLGYRVHKLFLETEFRVVAEPERFPVV